MSADAADKSAVDRLLDVGVYAPIGFFVTSDKDCAELALAGRKQVAFARSLGRAAIQGIGRSRTGENAPASAPRESAPAEPSTAQAVDGYDAMTARQVVSFLRTSTTEQAQWVAAHETATKQRVTVLRAAERALADHD